MDGERYYELLGDTYNAIAGPREFIPWAELDREDQLRYERYAYEQDLRDREEPARLREQKGGQGAH